MTITRIDNQTFGAWRDQIEDLFNSSVKKNFPDYCFDESYGRQKCDDLQKYLENGSAIVYGAINKEEMAGWIWCHEIIRMGKPRIHIAEIAVKDSYLRQGIGRLLLSRAEQYAVENGYDEIDLLVTKSNEAAVRFYESFLFETERYLLKKRLD